MATPSAAILCALLALLLWAPVGWLIARRLPLGRDLCFAAAPVLGWAVQNVVALHVATFGGFAPANVLAATMLICLAAILGPASSRGEMPGPDLPLWILAAAAVVAVGPASGILPKIAPEGVALADPIYDHAKIALVDEIVRTGVPPANPFLGAGGDSGSIAYYYYWLFGAAQLALISGASGWNADVAATWFTALFGQEQTDDALEGATGLAGWFFQTSWSPHHVASATSVLLSIILMERLARAPSIASTLVLGLLVAAGFGSSLWVGGITFALCGGVAGIVLLVLGKPGRRLAFLAALAIAGCIAVALTFPLLAAQLRSTVERGDGTPVLISPFPVLGPAVPDGFREFLDIPAYWLILRLIEFPAAWVLGAVAALRLKSAPMPALSAAALASLCGGWLLVSTAGENNDLGWRAVLPGLLILTAFAGAYFAHCLARRWLIGTIAGVALLSLALPDGFGLLRQNIVGRLSEDGVRFRDAPALWATVRRQTAADERVASNPRMMSDLAPWPIGLSWALLANRRSCFAGNELTLAFTSLTPEARARAADLFDRVFAGVGSDADLGSLVWDFDCKVIVLTPQDGAWSRDSFAASALFTRIEEAAGKWRIYRASHRK